MAERAGVLQVGDRVVFADAERSVVAAALDADAERIERRALTDRLTAVPAQARTRNRAAASPQKDKQHREDQHRSAQAPGLVR